MVRVGPGLGGLRDEWVLIKPHLSPWVHAHSPLCPDWHLCSMKAADICLKDVRNSCLLAGQGGRGAALHTGGQPLAPVPTQPLPPPQLLIFFTRCQPPPFSKPSIPGAALGRCHGNRATREAWCKRACFSNGSVGTSGFAEWLYKPAPSAPCSEHTLSPPTPTSLSLPHSKPEPRV